jgi:hypothetical protein
MILMEAILSGKPFRRPRWNEEGDVYKWVVLDKNDPELYFYWANDEGTPSPNIFGTINSITHQNDEYAEDYQIMSDFKTEEEKLKQELLDLKAAIKLGDLQRR